MGAGDDWQRLAAHVVFRRQQRGIPTRQALADLTGLSYRLLGDLERGTRRVSEGTLAILEQALGWDPGSAERILSGGEPTPIDEHVRAGDVGSKNSGPTSAMQVLSEAYRIAAEISKHGDEGSVNRLGEVLGDIGQLIMPSVNKTPDLAIRVSRPAQPSAPLSFRRSDPTVLRIALGRYLRVLREGRALEYVRVGNILGCSAADIRSLEIGSISFESSAMNRLLILYGVFNSDARRQCIEVAEEASRSGWWTRYNDVLPEWFRDYLNLEGSAEMIRSFEAQYIPGLLQTADYAREVISAHHKDVDIRLFMRMRRQEIFSRAEPVQLWVIIDESALRRAPIDIEIMRDQVEHLIVMSRRKNVVIQILPWKAKVGAGSTSFSLLRFVADERRRGVDGFPDIVYTEQLATALYIDNAKEVEMYRKLLDLLGVTALSPEESKDFLTKLSGELFQTMQAIGRVKLRA